ncbi:ABC transporter permease [Acidobacteriota bacterium]
MKILRNIRISRKSLFAHKVRTVLALSGITIGVAAVIIMTAIGQGAQKAVLEKIERMGSNLLIITAGQTKTLVSRQSESGREKTLKLDDSEAIAEECTSVSLVVPGQDRVLRTRYGNLSMMATILGTKSGFLEVRNFDLTSGRFFTDEENKASLRKAVLGSEVYEELFQGADPIGEMVRINKIPFEVIGILKSKGLSVQGSNQDDRILIPINTAMRRVFNVDYINTIFINVTSREKMNRAESEIRELLRERHRLNRRNKSDDFTIQNQITALRAERETSESFKLLIIGIAAISLFVGGIGILAVMLLTIRERISEIGLRMATGARRRDILVQFLTEALILGSAGGLCGVCLGAIGSGLASMFTVLTTSISPESIMISLCVSLAVGVLFGVLPARRASMLDPIEALRSE